MGTICIGKRLLRADGRRRKKEKMVETQKPEELFRGREKTGRGERVNRNFSRMLNNERGVRKIQDRGRVKGMKPKKRGLKRGPSS